MAKIGRPTKRTDDNRAAILTGLSQGKPLSGICAELKLSFMTVFDWEQSDPAFLEDTTRAREIGTHFIAGDTMRIADDVSIDPQHKRIMVDTRLRLIGKWNAKAYGDKVTTEITGVDGKDFNPSDHEAAAKLAAILEAVRARGGG